MESKQTYQDLELTIKRLRRTYVILIILLFSSLILFSYIGSKNKNLLEENKILEEQIQQPSKPEAINGNLYIGYEDGVRVGYHQDYLNKSIWYRCVKECEVIE